LRQLAASQPLSRAGAVAGAACWRLRPNIASCHAPLLAPACADRLLPAQSAKRAGTLITVNFTLELPPELEDLDLGDRWELCSNQTLFMEGHPGGGDKGSPFALHLRRFVRFAP
jgi:hypothetical protein